MGGWYCERMKNKGFVRLILRLNISTQKQVAIHVCGFDDIQKGNYFRGDPIRRIEVEVRVGKLKNRQALGKVR